MQNAKSFAALGFGEVMMRLSPVGMERIAYSDSFIKRAGGSELNVVSGIARLGLRTGLISKLPDSTMGSYIRNQIRSYGVSDDHVARDTAGNARLGIYYYESGVYPRKPQVVYDRAGSSFTSINMDEIGRDVFDQADLFHVSGITLALGEKARETAFELVKGFKAAGAKISFDVNYRAALWSEEEAKAAVEAILPYLDILFVSEETSRRMLGRTGELEDIQKGYSADYGISVVASTQRKILSHSRHSFGSVIYSAKDDKCFTAKPYENIEVVDRIGSGDAYVSGVLYSILSGKSIEEAVEYGNAMAAVKNTVPGDLQATTILEIESVIRDHNSVGVVSEMNR